MAARRFGAGEGTGLDESSATVSLERANVALSAGDHVAAAAMFEALVAENPDDPDVIHGLGILAWQAGQLELAREHVSRAVGLSARPVIYLSTLGEIERMRGDFVAAERALLTALEIQPDYAEAQTNLGMLYLSLQKYADAIERFRSAIESKPEIVLAHYNLGIALKELNQLDDAIAAYRMAIELKTDFVEAHVNLAIALLLDGQLEEGFEEYEWRLKPPFATASGTVQNDVPMWDGLVDPKGALVLRAEQGAGDVIQFVRYIPIIAREGMRVIVQCRPELENLVQTVEGVASTYRFDEPLPPHTAQLSLLSLPLLFGTRIDKIPVNVPYMLPPFAKVQAWRQRLLDLGETIKVGLRWAGNPGNTEDQRRSVALELFSGLSGVEKLTLISLQNESLPAADLETASKLRLVDFSAELQDFSDTAALMSNLDLVISVDTAVLHLAGALGCPTWGLLRYSPHWPWLLGRDDSPWYPGMRLFRQRSPGQWEDLIEDIVTLLTGAMQTTRDGGDEQEANHV